jgi:hypothetical protein
LHIAFLMREIRAIPMKTRQGSSNTRVPAKRTDDDHSSPRDPPSSTPTGIVAQFLSANFIPILIFLFALFFIITFSNPALFLNDEWITVNQLHQLGEGHQVIVNEGKYGTFQNGTPGPYFAARNNLLGYSLMLPILSLPALKIFGLFGDQFRIAVVLLWSFLPVAMALMVEAYRPQYARWKGIRWTWLVIGASFIGLLLNIGLYYPWPFTAIDAPIEAAAVVFTNHLIFAALAVMIYLICKTVFEDTWFSVFGTIACISCSSYIFWAANAKDHILVAALVAAVILFAVRYVRYGGFRDAALAFAFVGLLAWARAELGFTVFAFLLLYYAGMQFLHRKELAADRQTLTNTAIAPFATVIGIIPSLINNLSVTGNILVPPHYVYMKGMWAAGSGGMIGAEAVADVVQSVPAPTGGIGGFIGVLANYFEPSWSTLPGDVLGILFAPASGNMSLVAVSPLILLAIVVLPITYLVRRDRFYSADTWVIILLALISTAIWVAYLKSLPGLNASTGIIPDIRYFVPMYLPAGLLGLYAIRVGIQQLTQKQLSLFTSLAVLLVSPFLLLTIMLTQPFGGMYAGYTMFFTNAAFIVTFAVLLLILLNNFGIVSARWTMAGIALLVSIPLGWQMMMLFLYSIAKFNGYFFWIPAVETVYRLGIGIVE